MFFYNFRFFQATVMPTLWSSINLNTLRYLAIFAWFRLTGTPLGGLDSDLRCMDANIVSLHGVRNVQQDFSRSKVAKNKNQISINFVNVCLICL